VDSSLVPGCLYLVKVLLECSNLSWNIFTACYYANKFFVNSFNIWPENSGHSTGYIFALKQVNYAASFFRISMLFFLFCGIFYTGNLPVIVLGDFIDLVKLGIAKMAVDKILVIIGCKSEYQSFSFNSNRLP